MKPKITIEGNEKNKSIYRFTSHRRTITETDIVNFVNLVGLHEPPFIDMEWVQHALPESHNRRFAPAPFLISLGMGLVSTSMMKIIQAIAQEEKLGPFHGMVGVNAMVKKPAYPGDTLHVELEESIDRKTTKGQMLIDLKYFLKNQKNEVVVIFTEKVIFEPGK